MKILSRIKTFSEFENLKLATDSTNRTYFTWKTKTSVIGTPQISWNQIIFIDDLGAIYARGQLYGDVSGVYTKSESDSLYAKPSDITTEIGKLDLNKYVTLDQFTDSVDVSNLVTKGSMATINGQSLISGGNIEIDSSIYKIVTSLPESNALEDKIYLLKAATSTSSQTDFECWKWNGTNWVDLGPFGSVKIDLSQYLSKKEADQRYMVKSSNANSSLIVLDNGQVNNLGNNGQAYNAIRNVQGQDSDKWRLPTGSSFPLNCASFGVKSNGTTAFSHKKYDSYTYDKTTNTDKTTGARNTAVLVFSGNSGLMYAKNTGSANDVTEAMYKYVGVIDSPDERQRVYSVAQSDAQIDTLIQQALGPIVQNFNDQINELKVRIEDLENQNADLYSKLEAVIQKVGVTDEEIAAMSLPQGRGMDFPQIDMISQLQNETDEILEQLPENLQRAIQEATLPEVEDFGEEISWSDV